MTGGAFGSLFAQLFHLSSAERKTLLVAGAAAGMSAIFATPIAAVLLAVELLLFEWKPRSFIPVALSSAIAARRSRVPLLGAGPVFPVPPHAMPHRPRLLGVASVSGSSPGSLSGVLTALVYGVRRPLREAADPLDVVAGDRRARRRHRRTHRPARPRRRLRARSTAPARRSCRRRPRPRAWSWPRRSSGRSRSAREPRAASWRRCS